MVTHSVPDKLGQLLADFRRGDRDAAGELVELLYPELRRLAASKMNKERAGHTWEPTVLVNELYLELEKSRSLRLSEGAQGDKAAFFGLAGFLMNRLLVQHARRLYKRVEKVELMDDVSIDSPGAETLVRLDHLLSRLAEIDPKFRTVVELRVFEGLTGDEIAERMGCSRRTASSYWNFAKTWLQREFEGKPEPRLKPR